MNIIEMLETAKQNVRTAYSCDSWKTGVGQNYLKFDEIKEMVGYPQKEDIQVKLVIYYAGATIRHKEAESSFMIREKKDTVFSVESICDDWYEYEPATL